MGVVLTSVRSRLADAEPESADRGAERDPGLEEESRAPDPEECLGVGHLAPQGRLVRRSGLGTIFVMPQFWNQWDLLELEIPVAWSSGTWMSMGTEVSRISLV